MQEPEKPVKLNSKDQIAYDKEDNVQAIMDADYELATRIQAQERGELIIEERSKLFMELINERKKHFARLRAEEQRRKPPTKKMKMVNTFVPMDSEIEDDAEKEELRACLDIIPGDGVAINIIRANGSSKNYKIFSEMLDDFDRQDVLDLYRQGLFDSCGVHVLLMDTGVAIHMMVENKYPFTQEIFSRMLSRRLKVDHESEMAFELPRFTISQLQK
ncbi:hypothetical protein Tco_1396504 [Tanacetum coccineum]